MSPVLNLDTHKFLFTWLAPLSTFRIALVIIALPRFLAIRRVLWWHGIIRPPVFAWDQTGEPIRLKNVLVSLVERKFKIFATLYCHAVSIYVISKYIFKNTILPTILNTFQHLVVYVYTPSIFYKAKKSDRNDKVKLQRVKNNNPSKASVLMQDEREIKFTRFEKKIRSVEK